MTDPIEDARALAEDPRRNIDAAARLCLLGLAADCERLRAELAAMTWRLDAMARRAEAADATLALVLPSQDVYDAIDACRVLSGPDTDGCHTTKGQRVLVRTWLDDIRTYVGRVVR